MICICCTKIKMLKGKHEIKKSIWSLIISEAKTSSNDLNDDRHF